MIVCVDECAGKFTLLFDQHHTWIYRPCYRTILHWNVRILQEGHICVTACTVAILGYELYIVAIVRPQFYYKTGMWTSTYSERYFWPHNVEGAVKSDEYKIHKLSVKLWAMDRDGQNVACAFFEKFYDINMMSCRLPRTGSWYASTPSCPGTKTGSDSRQNWHPCHKAGFPVSFISGKTACMNCSRAMWSSLRVGFRQTRNCQE